MFLNRTNQKIAAYQNELAARQVAEVRHIYGEMRAWRHDYKSHLQTMKAYLALGKIDALAAYIDRLDEDLARVDTIVKSGCVALDAVLNAKLSLAREQGVEITATARAPEHMPVEDVDLCVLMGNLLDNALEACAKMPEGKRFLRVYLGVKRDHLYVTVTNSATRRVKRLGKRFATTKSGMHGYGLLRVDRVVAKYKGYVRRDSEEGAFVTEILLPI